MPFSYLDIVHVATIIFSSFFILLVSKVFFLVFPVQTDRRRVINSFLILSFFLLLNQLGVYEFAPWHRRPEYFKGIQFAVVLFSIMLFSSSLDYFIWNGVCTSGGRPGVPKIITNTLKAVLYFVSLVTAAKVIYNVNLSALLAGAGLVTFILGYASKQTLSNFFAGIAIQFGGKLKKGHHIKVDNMEGEIIAFNWRSTTISGTWDVVFPNSVVANDIITVLNTKRGDLYVAKFIRIVTSQNNNMAMIKNLIHETICECSTFGLGDVYLLDSSEEGILFEVEVYAKKRSDMIPITNDFYTSIFSKALKKKIYLGAPDRPEFINGYKPELPLKPQSSMVINAIRTNSLFSSLSEADVNALIDVSDVKFYSKGENVINQDASGNTLFFIIDGKFETNEFNHGERVLMRTLCASDLFGLKGFLLNEPRRISVRTESSLGWVLELRRDRFKKVVNEFQILLDDLAGILIQREA